MKKKVVFIVHMPEMFSGYCLLYNKLLDNSNFEPKIVSCNAKGLFMRKHSSDIEGCKIICNILKRDFGVESIPAVKENGEVVDLIKDLGADFVFFQTPHIDQMGYVICPEHIYKDTKICYFPYGVNMNVPEAESAHFDRRLYQLCWKLFLSNRDTVDAANNYFNNNNLNHVKKDDFLKKNYY